MAMRWVGAMAGVYLMTGLAMAQADRYDTGLRLRQLENAWDKYPAEEAHLRALPSLKRALAGFFSGRFTEASLMLDDARLRLATDAEPTPDRRFAESLTARPFARLVDPANGALAFTVKPFYDSRVAAVPGLTVHLRLRDTSTTIATTEADWPASGNLPTTVIPEGDHKLTVEVRRGDEVLASQEQTLSFAANLATRVAKLPTGRPEAATVEALTLAAHARLLTTLAGRGVYETDYPAARLLAEAEALQASKGERFYTAARSGQFWLTLPVGDGGGASIVRLFVPDGLTPDRPVPLVVALHGAGGSENLFFDGYGHGAVVELCQKRGWLLVAPRSLGFFGGGPPVPAVIDELAKRYPVDTRRVYLIGHSMGASQAVGLAQKHPERYAGMVALGGGGNVQKPEAFVKLPAFVAAGREDFALGGAKRLHRDLERAGSPRLTWREYPAVDHIVIVQAALADAFAWLDGR